MACTQGVCKFISKTDITIKHKNEMHRSKISAPKWKQKIIKIYKGWKRLCEEFLMFQWVLMAWHLKTGCTLFCFRNRKNKQARVYISNTLERKRKAQDRNIQFMDNYGPR